MKPGGVMVAVAPLAWFWLMAVTVSPHKVRGPQSNRADRRSAAAKADPAVFPDRSGEGLGDKEIINDKRICRH